MNEKPIKIQLFFAFSMVSIMLLGMFYVYAFFSSVNTAREAVDERLHTAVFAIKEFIPSDYVERVKKGDLTQTEFNFYKAKISEYASRIGVAYIYILTKNDEGRICFALDQDEPIMSVYRRPTEDIKYVYAEKRELHSQGYDPNIDSSVRSIIMPFTDSFGNFYIIGADVKTNYVQGLILSSILRFVASSLIGLVAVFLVTFIFAKKVSKPIEQLSNFTIELCKRDFDESIDFDEVSYGSKEIKNLSQNIDSMRVRLFEHIRKLSKTIKEKEQVEGELAVAGKIQESFLPKSYFLEKDIEISAFIKPAKQTGGDFFDYFQLDENRICFVIGDVSGKGMPAALFMAKTMTLVRSSVKIFEKLTDMIQFINDELSKNNHSCTFVTFFMGIFDTKTKTLSFVNCGHNPPFLLTSSGSHTMLSIKTNTILGVFEGTRFDSETLKLKENDTFFCYTDGVTEAMATDNSFFGELKLENILSSYNSNSSVTEIVNKVAEQVINFEKDCDQSDDITILAIKIL